MKKLFIIPIFLLFFIIGNAQGPNCLWANAIQTEFALHNSSFQKIAIDSDHNILIIGSSGYLNSLDNTLPFHNTWGCFIVKYDSSGNVLWVRTILEDSIAFNPSDISLYSVNTDANNNIYVFGNFNNRMFVQNQVLNSVDGSRDIFIIKYDKDGNLLWTNTAGGKQTDEVFGGIKVTKDGTIFITGVYAQKLNAPVNADTVITYFDSSSLTTFDSTFSHAFIACYNTNGTNRWVKSITGKGSSDGEYLSLDNLNNIYIVGGCDSTNYWDNVQLLGYNNPGLSRGYALKCDSNGNGLWSNSIITDNPCGGNPNLITTDIYGNSYIIGNAGTIYVNGVLTFVNSSYLIKFAPYGSFIWLKKIPSKNINSLSIDKDNHVLLSLGIDNSKVIIDNDTFQTNNPFDILMLKVSNQGNYIWKKLIKNKGSEAAFDIEPDDNSIIYSLGTISNTDTFCIDNKCNVNLGYQSIFLAKFHQTPTGIDPVPFNEHALTLFPNPAHETVSVNKTNIESSQIRVLDALGRSMSVNIITTVNQTQINTSQLPPGLYIVLLNDGNTVLSAKMMKE